MAKAKMDTMAKAFMARIASQGLRPADQVEMKQNFPGGSKSQVLWWSVSMAVATTSEGSLMMASGGPLLRWLEFAIPAIDLDLTAIAVAMFSHKRTGSVSMAVANSSKGSLMMARGGTLLRWLEDGTRLVRHYAPDG